MAEKVIIIKPSGNDIFIKEQPGKPVTIDPPKGGAVWGKLVGDIKDQEDLMTLISGTPGDEKEIITVLTASETEPSEAEQGDFYIDLSEHLLYQYDGVVWEVAEVSKDVIYITADTSHIYRYDGNQFVDVTGQKVDDTIYVSSIEGNALDQYTEKGLYTVCVGRAGLPSMYYTMVVNTSKRQARPRLIMLYSQLLYNHDGYLRRSKSGTSAWSDWTEYLYASKADVQEAKDWAVVGWVL